MTVTNVNSPRRVDEEILDNIIIMARHGQCVVITPFTLMGAMAPVTLAGALVQQTAEAMGIIALCQMVRPGTPCVMGGFTSNVDMRTGSPAFGTPEYVHAVIAGAQIGRRLKIPVRTSAVNASPMVDAQSTYETAFSLQAAILSHSHLINHAAGWLEGGLSASLEKIIVDAELLRNWAEILKPISFSDDDLAVDAIKDIAAGGHFFGSHAHAGPLRDRVLPAAAVGLVQLRELDGGRRTQCDRPRHRDLEENAGGLRAAAAGSGGAGGDRRLRRTPLARAAERRLNASRSHEPVDRQRAHVRGDACGRGRLARTAGARGATPPRSNCITSRTRRRSRWRPCGHGPTWARCSCAATRWR